MSVKIGYEKDKRVTKEEVLMSGYSFLVAGIVTIAEEEKSTNNNFKSLAAAYNKVYDACDKYSIRLGDMGQSKDNIVDLDMFREYNKTLHLLAGKCFEILKDAQQKVKNSKGTPGVNIEDIKKLRKEAQNHSRYLVKAIAQTDSVEDLATVDLEKLAFSKWQDANPLYLCPVWVMDILDEDSNLVSINNHVKTVKEIKEKFPVEINFDMLPYGFYPKGVSLSIFEPGVAVGLNNQIEDKDLLEFYEKEYKKVNENLKEGEEESKPVFVIKAVLNQDYVIINGFEKEVNTKNLVFLALANKEEK